MKLNIKNFNFKIRNIKLFVAILIIVIIALPFLYYQFMISPLIARNKFTKEVIERTDENSVFHVEKMLIYSSASVINNSNKSTLNNMSVCQYSDISIYIDNRLENDELTNENTVKELYIDNISLSPKIKKGTKILNYKNPAILGKYSNISELDGKRIDFKIINTNEENYNANYEEPVFYTDCSNPITLGYLNKNILKRFSVSDTSSTIYFNAKVLKEANISAEDINYDLDFTINIVNNLDQKFSYDMNINMEFDENFFENGYSFKAADVSGGEYRFLRN